MVALIEEIAPDLHRVVDSRRTPEQVLKSIVDGINTGNLDTLMPLYEPEAAFATQPGNLSHGLPGVRQALAGFIAMKGKLDLNVTRVLEVSDLALVTTAAVLVAFSMGVQAADAPHISGGTGADERAELLAKEKEYNLKILGAAKSGDYLAGVKVVIESAKKAQVLDATMGLRVSEADEIQGLDLSQHGEEGYIFI
jgi:ketosteroid isomerase-like protein